MMGDWTFFSNHGHVFFCLARDGSARLRDVAADVGLTERAVQKIVKDLQQAGYIEVRKQGRCNRYRINRRKFLRHPLESHCSVSKLVNLVIPGSRAAALAAAEQDSMPAGAAPEPARDSAPEAVGDARARSSAEPVAEPVAETPVAEEPAVEEPAVEEPAVEEPAVEAQVAEATVAMEPVAEEPVIEEPSAAEPAAPDAEKYRKRGKRRKTKPVDVRKQGSLF